MFTVVVCAAVGLALLAETGEKCTSFQDSWLTVRFTVPPDGVAEWEQSLAAYQPAGTKDCVQLAGEGADRRCASAKDPQPAADSQLHSGDPAGRVGARRGRGVHHLISPRSGQLLDADVAGTQ